MIYKLIITDSTGLIVHEEAVRSNVPSVTKPMYLAYGSTMKWEKIPEDLREALHLITDRILIERVVRGDESVESFTDFFAGLVNPLVDACRQITHSAVISTALETFDRRIENEVAKCQDL